MRQVRLCMNCGSELAACYCPPNLPLSFGTVELAERRPSWRSFLAWAWESDLRHAGRVKLVVCTLLLPSTLLSFRPAYLGIPRMAYFFFVFGVGWVLLSWPLVGIVAAWAGGVLYMGVAVMAAIMSFLFFALRVLPNPPGIRGGR